MKSEIKDNFDWDFYTSFYSDLSHLNTPEKAYNHWITYGKNENRISNKKSLIKNKCLIVTSFNQKGLNDYAKDFLNTYNLPFDLAVYSEDKLDLSDYNIKNLKFENLFDDIQFEQFINGDPPAEFESRRNYDTCNENCSEFCYEHIGPDLKNIDPLKICPHCDGNRIRLSAIMAHCMQCSGIERHVKECKKFSFKLFAQMNAIKKYKNNYEYILWIDADCVFNNVSTDDFSKLVKDIMGDKMMGCLIRYKTYTETGFMIYNINNKYLDEYFSEIRKIYLSHEIYYTQQNHDCWIMDMIRERLEKKYKEIIHIDLSNSFLTKKKKEGNKHILPNTPFIKYFYHHKGPRKLLSYKEKKSINEKFVK